MSRCVFDQREHLNTTYVQHAQDAMLVPTAWPEILQEDATSARIGGNWTFGHVTAKYAMEVAIEKAENHNMAVVSIVQTNHIGRLGEYVENGSSQRDAVNSLGGGLWQGTASSRSLRWEQTCFRY